MMTQLHLSVTLWVFQKGMTNSCILFGTVEQKKTKILLRKRCRVFWVTCLGVFPPSGLFATLLISG